MLEAKECFFPFRCLHNADCFFTVRLKGINPLEPEKRHELSVNVSVCKLLNFFNEDETRNTVPIFNQGSKQCPFI